MTAPLRRPDDDPPGAWRRNPYVLMLVLIPLSVVIMASVMIPLSIRSHDGDVIDDYYKRGLLIDRELARDEAAATLGLSGNVLLDDRSPAVTLTIDGLTGRPPAEVTLRFMHATRGGQDQLLQARLGADGRYHADFASLLPGRWYVRAEHGVWRLSGEFVHPGSNQVSMR